MSSNTFIGQSADFGVFVEFDGEHYLLLIIPRLAGPPPFGELEKSLEERRFKTRSAAIRAALNYLEAQA
jgi:hypothetical protein